MLAVGLTLTACSSGPGSSDTVPDETSTSAVPTSTTILPPDTTTTTRGLIGVSTEFGRSVIEVAGVPYTVAVADTSDEHSRGLMGVEDVSPLDGMLFVFDDWVHRTFWMKDTFIPLDIAFFDRDGFLVNQTTMEPCVVDECPVYRSEGAAQYALEAPLGTLTDLPADARLVVIGSLDGSGKEI